MSRCRACDKNLSDYESTRKYTNTTIYIDLCNHCFSGIYVQAEERPDLADDSYLGDQEHDTNTQYEG